MIIYEDLISEDEIVSDTFKLVENKEFPMLWECDCRKYMKRVGEESFDIGANPSAEDAEEDEGGEGETKMVHDIEDQFRLVWLKPEEGLKPSKKSYQAHLKSYAKKLLGFCNDKVAAGEMTEAELAEWKKKMPGAVKMILENYDNYDLLMGQSMNGDAMHVLIDFREDGVTPYAVVWKDGLKGKKV